MHKMRRFFGLLLLVGSLNLICSSHANTAVVSRREAAARKVEMSLLL